MQKKLKKIINKKSLYILVLLTYILTTILNQKLGNMDELWNFSSARNIAKGLIPYKDFNIITTPLSPYLNSILLKINSSLITFRISYFIYYIIIIYLLNKIINILKIKENIKYISITTIIIILIKNCYLDYNFIQLILILLLMKLHLQNTEYSNKKLNTIIPLLSGLTIINKQSTGIIIAIANTVLIIIKKIINKEKLNIKFIKKQIILTTIPILLFIEYLLMNNSISDFYDLAILGLKTFSNKLIISQMLVITLYVYILITIITYLNKKEYKLWIIYIYSLASITVVIPILDKVHTTIGLIPSLIFITYIINNKIKIKSKFTIIYILLIITIPLTINNIEKYSKTNKITTGIYKNIPTDIILETSINNVSSYIINKEKYNNIYILDFTSTLYNLNINKYNKYFDLFLKGNLGIKGQKNIINTINKDNKIFLINNQNKHWQTPTNIIDYVKENYKSCGNIEQFTIYCKK